MPVIHIETDDLYKAGHCFGYVLGGFVKGFLDGVKSYENDLANAEREEAKNKKPEE